MVYQELSITCNLSAFVYPVGPEDRTGAPLREAGEPRFLIDVCQCFCTAGTARYIGQGIGRHVLDHNLVFAADSYVKPVGVVSRGIPGSPESPPRNIRIPICNVVNNSFAPCLGLVGNSECCP